MKGTVPTPKGSIDVYCDRKTITVKSGEGSGVLRFKSSTKPKTKDGVILDKGNGAYEMPIDSNKQYLVSYKP